MWVCGWVDGAVGCVALAVVGCGFALVICCAEFGSWFRVRLLTVGLNTFLGVLVDGAGWFV